MSSASTLLELRALEDKVTGVYQRYLADLLTADVREFLISRRISRLTYAHRCLEASAVQEYLRRGVEVAPGMKISYVVRDAKRYVVDTEWTATTVMPGFTGVFLRRRGRRLRLYLVGIRLRLIDNSVHHAVDLGGVALPGTQDHMLLYLTTSNLKINSQMRKSLND